MDDQSDWLPAVEVRRRFIEPVAETFGHACIQLFWAVVDCKVRSRVDGRELSREEAQNLRLIELSAEDDPYSLPDELEINVSSVQGIVWEKKFQLRTYRTRLHRMRVFSPPKLRNTQRDNEFSTDAPDLGHPKREWTTLAQGPFHFRKRWTKGMFLDGTPLPDFEKQFKSHFSDNPPCRLVINANDCTLCIEFRVNHPSRLVINANDCTLCIEFRVNHPSDTEMWLPYKYEPRHFQDLDDLKNTEAGAVLYPRFDVVWCGLLTASFIWHQMAVEFCSAIDAEACHVFGRYGSRNAQFKSVPRDRFHDCLIKYWGGPPSEGGMVKLIDGTVVHSVFLAPASVRGAEAEAHALVSSEPTTKKTTTKKISKGKQPAIIVWLWKRFNGKPVSDPSFEPRKGLISDALRDLKRQLGGKLNEKTMQAAIDKYNDAVRRDGK